MQPRGHEELDGEEILWRRLTSSDWIVPGKGGAPSRVSSAAFKGRPDEVDLSVHVASLTTLDRVFSTLPYCEAVAEITANSFQSLGRSVRHTPEADDTSHASVILAGNYGQRKKEAKALAQSARLIENTEMGVRSAAQSSD
jgi:hypothetical protein